MKSEMSRRQTQRKNLLSFIGARSRINTIATKTSDDWNQLVENITSSNHEIEEHEEK